MISVKLTLFGLMAAILVNSGEALDCKYCAIRFFTDKTHKDAIQEVEGYPLCNAKTPDDDAMKFQSKAFDDETTFCCQKILTWEKDGYKNTSIKTMIFDKFLNDGSVYSTDCQKKITGRTLIAACSNDFRNGSLHKGVARRERRCYCGDGEGITDCNGAQVYWASSLDVVLPNAGAALKFFVPTFVVSVIILFKL